MSVKVGHEGLHGVNLGGQKRDQYGIQVSDNSPRRDHIKGHSQHTPRGKPLCDGVRVPVLNDIERYTGKGSTTTCRFDIVEKVTTVIKAGTYGPSDVNASTGESKMAGESMDPSHRITLHMSRQPTFHTTASRVSDQDMWTKISPYKWNQWVKMGREGDARDVLYKNTYCMERDNLRYRSLTLPRIGSMERPWTVGDKPKDRYRPTTTDHLENSTGVTIVPQQPRGTVVRFREYMRPYTYLSDATALEVKRFNSKQNQTNHFTTSRNGFPLIDRDARRSSGKSDRPLKFENSRYNKTHKETLFNKHVLPIYKTAFDRDYSSADTFKEYLESLQQCATANPPYMHPRENKKLARETSLDYHNQVLQHVRSVNEPDVHGDGTDRESHSKPQDNRSITIEIKSSWKELDDNESNSAHTSPRKEMHKTGTIENLSSVHGSVVHPSGDAKFLTGPVSSSVVNDGGNPTRVVIPSGNVPNDQNPRGSDGGVSCPSNTPTPMDDV